MIIAKPIPSQDPNDPNGWFQYGLPGAEMVKRRNRITQAIRDALIECPPLSFDVDAGAKTMVVTVWPLSSLTSDAMSRLQDVLSEESDSDFDFELFVGEDEPWWCSRHV